MDRNIKLQTGDRVQIVSEVPEDDSNWNSDMEEWLGEIMTVEKPYNADGRDAYMYEDNGEWCWDYNMIEKIVVEDYGDFEPATEDELNVLLKMG